MKIQALTDLILKAVALGMAVASVVAMRFRSLGILQAVAVET